MDDRYDVIVCGGGPAGIGATVRAARKGAKTLLLEHLFHLGGMSTSAFVSQWGDSPTNPLLAEIVSLMEAYGCAKWNYQEGRFHPPGRVNLHAETFKAVAACLTCQSGADILFGTVAESAIAAGDGVKGVVLSNKSGRREIRAKVVIDATADGNIAASAGCRFLKGDGEDGRMQNVNFRFELADVAWAEYEKRKPAPAVLEAIFRNAVSAGKILPPRGLNNPAQAAFPYDSRSGEVKFSYWELDCDASDVEEVSATLCECQIAALQAISVYRHKLPGFEHCRIGRFPAMLGTRESRRIAGRYVLTGDDVRRGRKFPDGIARAAFYIDFHDSPPGVTFPHSDEYKKANRPRFDDWYEIPYRCLVPEKITGLLSAGRCISADREGLASMRIMPTCMWTGEAAGTAAALACARGIDPHLLDGAEVAEGVMSG